jgi:hypothetical protein
VRQIAGGGPYPALAIGGDGKAVIVFVDGSGALGLAKCGDADCSTNTLLAIDASSTFTHAAIAINVVDSVPVVSYIDAAAGALKLLFCSTPTCSTNTRLVADDPANVLDGPVAIALGRFDNPNPLVIYRDATASALKALRCKSANCATSTVSLVDDPAGGTVGGVGGVAIASDGLPVMAYTDGIATVAKIAKCRDSACLSANVTSIDDTGDFGLYSSLALGSDGLPVIAYGKSSAPSQLNVLRCSNRSCW